MRIRFTKMHGAGNDFVVLDETRARLNLTPAQYRFLADRHFGVGADQILSVRPAPHAGVDFEYVIHNADGSEVEQCGNGSRCFVRFVREQGLTDQTTVRVQVANGVIELQEMPDGRVTVDMGEPIFDLPRVPFAPDQARAVDALTWQLQLGNGDSVKVGVVSMGNPHAVQCVPNVETQRNPLACVRARRGRDAGLRHGCVRSGGGWDPLGSARCASAGAHAWGLAHHSLGGRRPARAHDGACNHGVPRRN